MVSRETDEDAGRGRWVLAANVSRKALTAWPGRCATEDGKHSRRRIIALGRTPTTNDVTQRILNDNDAE
jgi:hypothetical protein